MSSTESLVTNGATVSALHETPKLSGPAAFYCLWLLSATDWLLCVRTRRYNKCSCLAIFQYDDDHHHELFNRPVIWQWLCWWCYCGSYHWCWSWAAPSPQSFSRLFILQWLNYNQKSSVQHVSNKIWYVLVVLCYAGDDGDDSVDGDVNKLKFNWAKCTHSQCTVWFYGYF